MDGLQDGGRVNNTQLIALFPFSWRKNGGGILSQAAGERATKLRVLQLDISSGRLGQKHLDRMF